MTPYRSCMPEHQIFVRIPRAGVQLFWCWKVLRMHNRTKQPRMRKEGPVHSGAPCMTVVRGPFVLVDTDSDASSDTIPSESSTECPHREWEGVDSDSSTDVVAGPAIPTAFGSGGGKRFGDSSLHRGAGGRARLNGGGARSRGGLTRSGSGGGAAGAPAAGARAGGGDAAGGSGHGAARGSGGGDVSGGGHARSGGSRYARGHTRDVRSGGGGVAAAGAGVAACAGTCPGTGSHHTMSLDRNAGRAPRLLYASRTASATRTASQRSMQPVASEFYARRGGVAPFGDPTAHSAGAASGESSETGRGALAETEEEARRLSAGTLRRVKGSRTLETEPAAIAGAVSARERHTAPYDASVASNPGALDGREVSGERGTHEHRAESGSGRAASKSDAASSGRTLLLGSGRGPYGDASGV